MNTEILRRRGDQADNQSTTNDHLHDVNGTFNLLLFIFLTAKNLVASLLEVDQDQRLTAQEAIAHEW